MPSVEDLLVPALDVADTSVVMVAQDAEPFNVHEGSGVHLPPHLLKLRCDRSLVAETTVLVDATRVEVVSHVDNVPCPRTVLHELLLAGKHTVADQALGNAIDLLDARCTVGHRARLAWVATIWAADAYGWLGPVVALVPGTPTTHAAPVTNGEEGGHRLFDVHGWPVDAVVRLRIRGHGRLVLGFGGCEVEEAQEFGTCRVGVGIVAVCAGLADGLLPRPEAALAVAAPHRCGAIRRPGGRSW
mmetsp:Transcript_44410/g.102618  ORF Transcript_44410/g.102618 Transcript_44410/m.102618 type:complete len:244 (+) Transcript_44410:872-1603(+)